MSKQQLTFEDIKSWNWHDVPGSQGQATAAEFVDADKTAWRVEFSLDVSLDGCVRVEENLYLCELAWDEGEDLDEYTPTCRYPRHYSSRNTSEAGTLMYIIPRSLWPENTNQTIPAWEKVRAAAWAQTPYPTGEIKGFATREEAQNALKELLQTKAITLAEDDFLDVFNCSFYQEWQDSKWIQYKLTDDILDEAYFYIERTEQTPHHTTRTNTPGRTTNGPAMHR